MKIGELKKILSNFNWKTLGALIEPISLLGDTNLMPENCASVTVQIPDKCFCFCGRTSKGYTLVRDFINTCLTLSDSQIKAKSSVAVGAVIDDKTEHSPSDLPVILAVGINYGQGTHYLKTPVLLIDSTNMRDRLEKVLAKLANHNCPVDTLAVMNDYHLVAANFFPWVTSRSWSAYSFNGIEEASLIHCCGHADPIMYIVDLIKEIQPTAVIFHGANNAVPYFGGCVVRKYLQTNPIGFETVFSDNLAPSYQPDISNGIKLCSRKSGRGTSTPSI